jgi:hypothetical protein
MGSRSQSRRQIARRGPLLALLCLTLAPPVRAAERVGGAQSQLMAAIILNFARFTEWPPTRFATATAPIVLCADSSDPFTASLGALDGQVVGARRLSVRRMTTEDFGPECHLAFIPPARASTTRLSTLEQQGVLLIGEGEDFARSGAIALVRVGREIRFEVNDRVAQRSGVKLSSKLLRLALTVR